MADGEQAPLKEKDLADWPTVRRFLPYLWPKERPDLRWRIAWAALFVVIAKAVVLTLPFAYAGAVDAMSKGGDEALWVALGLVLAYAGGRFATVLFDNVRNINSRRSGGRRARLPGDHRRLFQPRPLGECADPARHSAVAAGAAVRQAGHVRHRRGIGPAGAVVTAAREAGTGCPPRPTCRLRSRCRVSRWTATATWT